MSQPQLIQTTHITQNLRIEGNGPPLLFLGSSGFDLSVKAAVFDSALVDHFTVAAADPRGLGYTETPEGAWTMRDYAQDALDILDHLGWEQACVLGESFGAMVALELAIMAPQRVSKLGLAAGASGGQGGASYPIHEFLAIEEPRARAIKSLVIKDTRFEALLTQDPSEAEESILARIQNDAQFLNSAKNAQGYPRLLTARADHDCWDRLHQITADTLLIAGDYDNQAPMDRAEAIATRIPNTTLLRFPSGHAVCFDSDLPVKAIVQRW